MPTYGWYTACSVYVCVHTCTCVAIMCYHVWAGISLLGWSGICIFEGTMKKELFIDILDATMYMYPATVCPKVLPRWS